MTTTLGGSTKGLLSNTAGIVTGLVLWFGTLAGLVMSDVHPQAQVGVITLLMMNVTVLCLGIGVEVSRRPYSLHLMHLVSVFLFLGAPAVFQYARGRFAIAGPIGGVGPYVLPTAFAILGWITTYLIFYETHHRFSRISARSPVRRFLSREVSSTRAFAALVLSALVIVYLALVVGLTGLGTRAATEQKLADFTAESAGSSGFYTLILLVNGLLLRAFPLVALGAGIQILRKRGVFRSPMLLGATGLVAAAVLVATSPFAASRTWLVVSMFGIVGPLVFLRRKAGWMVVATIVGGLAFLPALSDNRHALSFDEWLSWFRLVSPFDYLAQSTDTDSFGMTLLIEQWVQQFGHRWGQQILAGIFFFVPRRIWPDKAVGTGRMVTEDLGFEFNNLSPPILAEGLVDFGFLGVVVLAAIVAIGFSKIDQIHWSGIQIRSNALRVVDVIYPFWFGLVMLLTRGDILAAVSHIAAFTTWIAVLGFGSRAVDSRSEGDEIGSIGEDRIQTTI